MRPAVNVNGDKIKHLRNEQGISQDKLALMSNVNRRTVQRAENGEAVSLETLAFIADALGVDKDILIEAKEASIPEGVVENNEGDEKTKNRYFTIVLGALGLFLLSSAVGYYKKSNALDNAMKVCLSQGVLLHVKKTLRKEEFQTVCDCYISSLDARLSVHDYTLLGRFVFQIGSDTRIEKIADAAVNDCS